MDESKLRLAIAKAMKEIIENDPDIQREISTTGNVAGFESPYAFRDTGGDDDEDDDVEDFNNTYGYTTVDDLMDSITLEDVKKIIASFKDLNENQKNSFRKVIKFRKKTLNEEFTPEQERRIERIIRKELAEVFFDLFQRRSVWTRL